MTVAALYIDPGGPYPTLPDVECWDESRDARKYDGPWPVVAHPPCRNYSKLRHLATGDDSDCAPRAIAQVHAFGGILEHPAGSLLWKAAGLPLPGELWNEYNGYTVELEQVEWGHVARKRTWLYVVGAPRGALEAPPFPGRQPTHWASGRRGMANPADNVPPGIKVCSAQQRRRTPIEFARYLVRLAESAGKNRSAA